VANPFLWADKKGVWHLDLVELLALRGLEPTPENIKELTEILDSTRDQLPPGSSVVIEAPEVSGK
jgi:hypothetical protein